METTTPNRAWLLEVLPKEGKWAVVVHYKNEQRLPRVLDIFDRKADAEAYGRKEGRRLAEAQGNSVQLHVKKKDGTIPAGSHGHSTYGHDPAEIKG